MDLASYLAGRRDTLESLIEACEETVKKAEIMGLRKEDARISYSDLKESLESLVEGTSNDKELS